MKKSHWLFIGGAVLLVGAGVWYFFFKPKAGTSVADQQQQ